jgi:hypothetical protein
MISFKLPSLEISCLTSDTLDSTLSPDFYEESKKESNKLSDDPEILCKAKHNSSKNLALIA